MIFSNVEYLWLLLLIPLLAGYLLFFKAGDRPSFKYSSTQKLGSFGRPVAQDLGTWLPGIIRLLAFILIIMAVARPQKGLRSSELTTKTTDIMFCLDSSGSMRSVDFKPENRFEVAKNVISEFIKGREYDRMGMVIFAEHALTQCPLTLDRSALLNILEFLEIGMIPENRTAVGSGIATAVNRLKDSQAKSKVIILLTDGSNNAGSIDPVTAAKTAATYGIKIYSIGTGSPDGGLIPVQHPIFGERLVPTQNDLDEDTLLKIAGETDGKYFRAKTAGALKTIFNEIDLLEKTDIKIKEYVDYQELFIWFLIPAIILILLEITISKTWLRTVP